MDISIKDIFRRVRREIWERKKFVTTIHVFVALLFLGLAWLLPRIYISSSIILVDQQNILRPLMEGTAVTTSVVDRAKMASQVIFSRSAMDKILLVGQWFDENPTPQERELKAEDIRQKTQIKNEGKNLFSISFRDNDPQRSFRVTKAMTDIFVSESLVAKQKESRSAYDFIDNQVDFYHKKLLDADNKIKDFRAKHVDSATPGSKELANERLLELRQKLEANALDISIEKSKLISLRQQLTGQNTGISSASLQRESELGERIVLLEQQLDELRLNYLDSYPDIVKAKAQIKSLEKQIREEVDNRTSSRNRALVDGPLYQELRSLMSKTQTKISSLETTRDQIENLYVNEQKKIERINAVDAEISELTRDYAVNQEMYQTLLRQRESAMISMNIDIANQGLTIKVQESASLPVNPKGLRFGHVILAGLALSFFIPIGGAYVLSQLDGKIRDKNIISEKLMLPVLASVYFVNTKKERRNNYVKASVMLLIVGLSISAYGYAIYLRLQG